jgi:Bacterial Ig-like domain (group 2)
MGLAYTVIDPAGDEIRDLQGTTIQWVSRNADVASVDSAGLVRAKSLGTTEIVLSINGFTDSTLVRVAPEAPPGSPVEPIPPSPQPVKPPTAANPPAAAPATASVAVTLDSASLAPGHASAAHAVAKDPKGNVLSGKTAIWSSLNTSVATVSTAGVVTAQKAGTASIQGAIDGVSGTASITVTVPPVVAPVVPPPTSSPDLAEPTFDGTLAKMLFQQTFDSYTTDSLRWPCGTAKPSMRVVDHSINYCANFQPGYDPGVVVGAGHSGNGVQWHYDGVYQEAHGVEFTGGVPATGKAPTIVQYWARFTPDVPGALTTKDANGYPNAVVQIKNIMLWNDISRFQIHMHAHTGGCPYNGPSYTMLGQYDQGDSQCNADQPVGPFFGSYADGGWHRWTIYYKPNTSKGSRDGVARLWIDGVLTMRVEASAVGVTPPGAWKAWCLMDDVDNLYSGGGGVSALEWGGNRTDGSGIPFTMAIDDVKWWVMR